MPYFLLTFGDARRPPVGAIIIEAPSMFQARMTAVVRRLAPGVPFGEGLKLTAKMMAAIPPEEIGRMMSGVEAADQHRVIVRHSHRLCSGASPPKLSDRPASTYPAAPGFGSRRSDLRLVGWPRHAQAGRPEKNVPGRVARN